MKWIFSFLILVLISSIAISDHTLHRNRVLHEYERETRENTYASAIDEDLLEILRARSRTSSRHYEGSQRWTAFADVTCYNEEYRGNSGFANYTPTK